MNTYKANINIKFPKIYKITAKTEQDPNDLNFGHIKCSTNQYLVGASRRRWRKYRRGPDQRTGLGVEPVAAYCHGAKNKVANGLV